MKPKRRASKKRTNPRKTSRFWVIFPIILTAIFGLIDSGTKIIGHIGPKTTASQPANKPSNIPEKPEPIIKPKDISEEIKRIRIIQALLKNSGFDPGPIDGIMGPRTQGAIRQFQNKNGLPETGLIDDKILDAFGVKTTHNPFSVGVKTTHNPFSVGGNFRPFLADIRDIPVTAIREVQKTVSSLWTWDKRNNQS